MTYFLAFPEFIWKFMFLYIASMSQRFQADEPVDLDKMAMLLAMSKYIPQSDFLKAYHSRSISSY